MDFKYSSSGIVVRSFNTSDDVSTSVSPRDVLVNASSTANVTVKDVMYVRNTSATIDSVNDVIVSLPITVPMSSVSFSSQNTTIATVNASGQVSRVADGMTNIVVANPYGNRIVSVSVARKTGQVKDVFSAFVSGSLAKATIDAINAKLVGKTAPTFSQPPASYGTVTASSTISDLFNSDGTRNTGAWFANMDTTCIPQSVGQNGVLVSPRDIICTQHYGGGSNPTFRDNANNTYSRSIIASRVIGATDIRVCTLDSDVPSSVSFARVLPTNWRSTLPNVQFGITTVATNQDRRMIVLSSFTNPTVGSEIALGQTTPWAYGLRGGDSGSPAFIPVNNKLVLLLTWHTAGGGPIVSDNIVDINSAMTSNGSPYTLSTVDLSGFTSY